MSNIYRYWDLRGIKQGARLIKKWYQYQKYRYWRLHFRWRLLHKERPLRRDEHGEEPKALGCGDGGAGGVGGRGRGGSSRGQGRKQEPVNTPGVDAAGGPKRTQADLGVLLGMPRKAQKTDAGKKERGRHDPVGVHTASGWQR